MEWAQPIKIFPLAYGAFLQLKWVFIQMKSHNLEKGFKSEPKGKTEYK